VLDHVIILLPHDFCCTVAVLALCLARFDELFVVTLVTLDDGVAIDAIFLITGQCARCGFNIDFSAVFALAPNLRVASASLVIGHNAMTAYPVAMICAILRRVFSRVTDTAGAYALALVGTGPVEPFVAEPFVIRALIKGDGVDHGSRKGDNHHLRRHDVKKNWRAGSKMREKKNNILKLVLISKKHQKTFKENALVSF
jgi:hypothetical protein